jgi:glycine cleavage system P protein (glycine dehydrogenase) subunit 1
MRFIPHTDADVRGMLAAIGAPSVESLFDCVPEKLRLRRALALPAAASEQEVLAELAELAERNAHSGSHPWFLGAGSYAHFVPSAVDALASRGEFYTAYTPYQAEISQGTLQTIFEWQTMMAGLTGLEVANASMYDGASATAEAALMAMRVTRRHKVAVSAALHPSYRAVLETYLAGLEAEVVTLPRGSEGTTELPAAVDTDTACLVIQQPNFLGCIEDLAAAAAAAGAGGALLVSVTTEALSLALLRPPGACGADIACGEAQSFGVPLGFGGPHLGFLCTRSRHVRQMPGRVVGATQDACGRRGFVLTLSTREQHIRRERATSNICTNQGLCLLMATIYLALLGRRGLRALAEQNLAKAEYAKHRLREAGLPTLLPAPTFNEFAVSVPGGPAAALARAEQAGIVAGLDLGPHVPELGPALLVCATELASRSSIDRLAEALGGGGA